jgi:GNAT superfamily N-acetyltransferase
MDLQVEPATLDKLRPIRERFVRELDCQFVHYSFFERGLADPYAILAHQTPVAYGLVSNKYDKGRFIEFFVAPEFRAESTSLFAALLAASGATHIEAQTNMPSIFAMLREFGVNAMTERLLFQDASASKLSCQQGIFRKRDEADGPNLFGQKEDTLSKWVLEASGEIVAAGGFLTHYNPPYADIFMAVAPHRRRQGFGSYLVQEVKKVCYEAGKKPAARCDPANIASRKSLEKAGMPVCGEILVAEVRGL